MEGKLNFQELFMTPTLHLTAYTSLKLNILRAKQPPYFPGSHSVGTFGSTDVPDPGIHAVTFSRVTSEKHKSCTPVSTLCPTLALL